MDGEILSALRENPPHLAQFDCGHIERFVLSPVVGWSDGQAKRL